jgi:hypothetical protein
MEVYENDNEYSNFDKLKLVFHDDDYLIMKYFSCGIASDGSKFANDLKKRIPTIAGIVAGGVAGDVIGGNIGIPVGGAVGGLLGEAATALIDNLINKGIKIPGDIIEKEFNDIDYSRYRSLSEMFSKYFELINKGNEIGMGYNKKDAIEYFTQASHYALDIKRKSNGLINENWINATIIADIYARLGSIYTDITNFSEASRNFYEADKYLEMCEQENKDENVNFLDRRIEIKGYDMGNSMRNTKELELFLGSQEFDAIEKDFTNKIDLYIQKLPERNSFASYFDKRLMDMAQEYAMKNNNYFYSNIYIYDKMRYLIAIGKFLATRACYDFIQYGLNKNNISAKEETQIKIHKGLNLIIEGYDISTRKNIIYRDTLIEDYLTSNSCYNLYIQKTMARNFTILLGLGYFSTDEDMINKYMQLMIRLDKKERQKNCGANSNIMWGSVQTAIEKVLKPYNVNIPSYEKIKEQIDKENNGSSD